MKPVNLSLDFSHAGGPARPAAAAISTGYPALDAMLPRGGWPVGGITEIFCADDSRLVLPLVWPALARLSQAKRWLAMIAPPNAPSRAELQAEGIDLGHVLMIHPHATSNGLWAVEHALRAGTCAAVLSWVNQADRHAMQDLRGAALAGNSCGLIFRPHWTMEQPGIDSLRLRVTATAAHGLYVELLEQRRNRAASGIFIETVRFFQTG